MNYNIFSDIPSTPEPSDLMPYGWIVVGLLVVVAIVAIAVIAKKRGRK